MKQSHTKQQTNLTSTPTSKTSTSTPTSKISTNTRITTNSNPIITQISGFSWADDQPDMDYNVPLWK